MMRKLQSKPTSALDEIMRENLKKKPRVERSSKLGSTTVLWSSV